MNHPWPPWSSPGLSEGLLGVINIPKNNPGRLQKVKMSIDPTVRNEIKEKRKAEKGHVTKARTDSKEEGPLRRYPLLMTLLMTLSG